MILRDSTEIITRLEQLDEKIAPDLQKKVGNFFLNGNPYVAKVQKVKPEIEPDTEWEDELLANLNSWVDYATNDLANYFKKNKPVLDKLAKEFPKALQPPVGSMAYRGTAISTKSLEIAFKTKQFRVLKIKGREVFHFKNLTYSPIRNAQSWTTDPKVAFRFDGNDAFEKVGVIYVAKVNKDFIFNPELMNAIFHGYENEIVRVAKKGVFEAYVDSNIIYNHWKLSLEDGFIHKLPSAEPYFEPLITLYNKFVKARSKDYGPGVLKPVNNVNSVFKGLAKVSDPNENYNLEQALKLAYKKCSKKYLMNRKKN